MKKLLFILVLLTPIFASAEEKVIWTDEDETKAKSAREEFYKDEESSKPEKNSEERRPPKENIEVSPSNEDVTGTLPEEEKKSDDEESSAESTKGTTAPVPTPDLPKWVESGKGKIKVLNKVYTRNKEAEIKKGQEINFGSLKVKLEKCFSQPESDKKESSALLLISETFKSSPTKELFHGWMFSSSPAISALEHPLYDVILLSCEDEQKDDTKKDAKDENKKDAKTDKKSEVKKTTTSKPNAKN